MTSGESEQFIPEDDFIPSHGGRHLHPDREPKLARIWMAASAPHSFQAMTCSRAMNRFAQGESLSIKLAQTGGHVSFLPPTRKGETCHPLRRSVLAFRPASLLILFTSLRAYLACKASDNYHVHNVIQHTSLHQLVPTTPVRSEKWITSRTPHFHSIPEQQARNLPNRTHGVVRIEPLINTRSAAQSLLRYPK